MVGRLAGKQAVEISDPLHPKKPLALLLSHHYPKRMILRLLLSLLLITAFAGCETPYKKSDQEEKKAKRDQSKDPLFTAFLGRLRIAVNKKDRAMLTNLMTSDFGYRWDNPPAGEVVFDYWDKHNSWGQLSKLLSQHFSPNGEYLVSPPEVVSDANYAGYRVGMLNVRGSWRFAYFVPAEGAQ